MQILRRDAPQDRFPHCKSGGDGKSWVVSHLRCWRYFDVSHTQRLRAGLTCGAPPVLELGETAGLPDRSRVNERLAL
jgi:hypothetical protein